MLYQFDTDSLDHAKAALLLYAMYRSRGLDSPLTGVETWNRFSSFMRGACLKASTTAQFVQEFCRKAKIDSVKPKYLSTGEPVAIAGSEELIVSEGYHDYQLGIIEDNSLLKLFNSEPLYLIMLVRERIQREKLERIDEDEEAED